MESAYKPGSVVSNHSSRARVTTRLKQPTRVQRGPRQRTPIWSCSERGLPCRKLLPVARCALTAPFHPYLCQNMTIGGILSVALSVGSRPPGVTWHPALWSPDFPPAIYTRQITGDCPADSRRQSKDSASMIQGFYSCAE